MAPKIKIVGGVVALALVLGVGAAWLSGPSDTANADDLIKQDLLSPATFSAISNDVVWSGKNAKGDDARVVKVVYDAQNGFGALVRKCEYVAFWYEGSQYFRYPSSYSESCDILPDEKSIVDNLVAVNFSKQAPPAD